MKRVIQVKSRRTGIVYELLTNDRSLTPFDVLEFHGIVQNPKRVCDRERGYSLIERNKFLDDEDFIVIKDEEVAM
jgi:hypothetical protein